LTGAGPETFSSAFPQVQSAALSRAYPAFYHESAHNIFLDALTAQGAPGLLLLLALTGLGLYAAHAARKREPALAAILGACLIAVVVTHQFTVFTTPTALYFYLTLAMLITVRQVPDLPSRMPRRMRPMSMIISLTLITFAIRLLVADSTLAQVRKALETRDTTAAAIAYQRARTWGLTADLWYSREMAAAAVKATDQRSALQAWQQALESGVRATSTSDDPHNAWYSLATLHARENDFDPTERCLRAAIASSPNWFKPHWMLAQVLQTEGHREEARKEATAAADLDGGRNPEVAQTLARIMANKE
jgi:tetratricopeptide (TPR) repeat protein